MNERIFSKCRAYIEKYRMIKPEDTIVAGISGGPDSLCMLLLLCRLRKEIPFRLMVVHINHGIRPEGAKDAAYVESLCAEFQLPFFLAEEDVRGMAVREGISEEEAGRNVRYLAFRDVLQREAGGSGKIAVAHNANDRAETMLFHLFRGTGLVGLGSIRPVREEIIRPILCLSREEIELFLTDEGRAGCLDETNLQDDYTRNKIRHHILNYASAQVCSNAVGNMWDTADRIMEAAEYILEKTKECYAYCLCSDQREIILDAQRLNEQEAFLQKQILLYTLERLICHRKDITAVHVEDCLRLLKGSGGRTIMLPDGCMVMREYEYLTFTKKEWLAEKKTGRECILLNPEETVEIPGLGKISATVFAYEKSLNIPRKTYTKWFDYDKISKIPVFRTRKTGDYLTINPDMMKKTLNRYMIDEKISKYSRDDLYVLADESHIIWVPGYRISQYYKVTDQTKKILQVQTGGEN